MGGAGGGSGGWGGSLCRALPQALLCALSIACARRARPVTGGPVAGFLLQAVAAGSDVLDQLWPSAGGPDPLPGSWVSAMVAQPLVASGFHRLSGDSATADLLLATATTLALLATGLAEEGRWLAARAVALGTAGTLATLAGLTGDVATALGALLWAGGNLAVATGSPGGTWAVAAGTAALGLRRLRE